MDTIWCTQEEFKELCAETGATLIKNDPAKRSWILNFNKTVYRVDLDKSDISAYRWYWSIHREGGRFDSNTHAKVRLFAEAVKERFQDPDRFHKEDTCPQNTHN